PGFRAQQLWQWVYHWGIGDFAKMTNLGKPLRAALASRYEIRLPEVARHEFSQDGTQKWLLRLVDGHEIEMVFIPEARRATLCVSSQVGCTLACRFCHTGTQKLVRNLAPGEIVGQILLARATLVAQGHNRGLRAITNIVMMGMGEPLYNFDNVAKALKIVMDGEGMAISKRRITLSTAGVVPLMARCGEELGVKLAVSLHAVTDDLRDRIVPLNKKYPVAELIAACRAYPGAKNSRRITFEYVMLRDVNDSPADAKALVQLIKGIPSKINLIPFNPWPGVAFERSSDKAIETFAAIVRDAGYPSPVRSPRGEDILAACGQLKSASRRLTAVERLAAEMTAPAVPAAQA
ncbi:MAG: 23S rRNA (adenine(2503)-C(2))-methyltransferase RlmN, partial [Alphaproteobacteria bacterium]